MKHCLIVDDSSVVRKVARQILEGMRFEVAEAENGQQALELCQSQRPDAIIVDWHMPVMGGLDFLNAYRHMHGSQRPFIIYLTTENDPVDISRAFAAGADDYVLKPFTRENIEAKFIAAGMAS
ncbi:MAG TPA: response regulator [Hyphomicrobiaceae bacterium]|nr:response regulator [Hyphomicrobiaceae bacterium]